MVFEVIREAHGARRHHEVYVNHEERRLPESLAGTAQCRLRNISKPPPPTSDGSLNVILLRMFDGPIIRCR
jgi:hypothetical protein